MRTLSGTLTITNLISKTKTGSLKTFGRHFKSPRPRDTHAEALG